MAHSRVDHLLVYRTVRPNDELEGRPGRQRRRHRRTPEEVVAGRGSSAPLRSLRFGDQTVAPAPTLARGGDCRPG